MVGCSLQRKRKREDSYNQNNGVHIHLEADHRALGQGDCRVWSARPLQNYDDGFPTAVYDGFNFLAGDFNTSLTQVVPQLKQRNLKVDTCSWHPWLYYTKHSNGIRLGIDSCAIFYVGGDVKCQMPLSVEDITSLAAKASEQSVGPIADRSRSQASGAVPGGPQSRQCKHLDSHAGNNVPGQIWSAYNHKKQIFKSLQTQ